MRRIALLLLLASEPGGALASGGRCWLVQDNAAASISGGSITTSAWSASVGGLVPSMQERPDYLTVAFDLVDANDGISNVRLTFQAAQGSAGTYRTATVKVGAVRQSAIVLDYNPQLDGKSWVTTRIPWSYPYGKLTASSTGHGAGDTLAIGIYGCTGAAPPRSMEPAYSLAAGGGTAVDCSAGAAYSAQLSANAEYLVQARSGGIYVTQATAGSGQDADSGDLYLPEDGMWLIGTHNGARYLTCDGSAETGTAVYQEVQ